VRSEREELLPEVLLDLPEVGGLAGEGGAMNRAEGGEPLSVVPTEEEVDVFIGVYAEELADDLDGKDLGIGDLGGRTALADAKILDSVVYETEDGHDEGAKIHKKKTSVAFDAVGLTPSVRGSSPSLKSSKKLAHGVR
jgi:hypothetical protein